MVIDTSAVLAILLAEPEAESFSLAIENAPTRLLSAGNLLEASIVIDARKGAEGARDLDLLIYRGEFEIVAVDLEQAEAARAAWRKFGRGRHRARLNYGDCFAYALASVRGQPLLFKGRDFGHTDVVSAVKGGSG